VWLLAPDGSCLVSGTYGMGGFVDVRTLPTSSGYAIVVDPSGAAVGSLTLTLYDVPADPAYTISPGGAPVTVSTGVPGQNARLAFTGSGGERVSLALRAGTTRLGKPAMLAPRSSTLVSGTYGNKGWGDV